MATVIGFDDAPVSGKGNTAPSQAQEQGITVETWDGAEPTERNASRLRGAVSRVTDSFRREPQPAPKPKQTRTPRTTPGTSTVRGGLQPETVVAFLETFHNVPASLLELENFRVEAETIRPYSQALADYINANAPDIGNTAENHRGLLGVLAYLGVVEGPTWIATYREILEKSRKIREERETGTVPTRPVPARPVPVDPIRSEIVRGVGIQSNGHTRDVGSGTASWSQLDALDRIGRT